MLHKSSSSCFALSWRFCCIHAPWELPVSFSKVPTKVSTHLSEASQISSQIALITLEIPLKLYVNMLNRRGITQRESTLPSSGQQISVEWWLCTQAESSRNSYRMFGAKFKFHTCSCSVWVGFFLARFQTLLNNRATFAQFTLPQCVEPRPQFFLLFTCKHLFYWTEEIELTSLTS